jgi:hypothetical protein
MKGSLGGIGVAVLAACTFDATLYDPPTTTSTSGSDTTSNTSTSSSATSGQGGSPPMCDPATCPPPSSPCQVVGCANDACTYVTVTDGTILSDGVEGNCTGHLCNGTMPPAVVALATDFVNDGNPCTLESCVGTSPTRIDADEGTKPAEENGATCDGVCQGHEFAGTCGYRLSRRTLTISGAQGAWSTNALSFYWNGPNAPPPTHIDAIEETTTGSRLMVFRRAPNEPPTYYERNGTVWKTPVPTASLWAQQDPTDATKPILAPEAIASMSTGRALDPPGNADVGLISTTVSYVDAATCPGGIRVFYYRVPDAGAITFDGSLCLEHRDLPNTPPWESVPIDWTALLQTGSNPYAISVLGVGDQVYQENFFSSPPNVWSPPGTGATSTFGFGLANAPDFTSIVAATNHRALSELQFISN